MPPLVINAGRQGSSLQLEETELSLEELIARVKKQAEGDKNGGVTLGEAFLATVGFMDKALDAASKTPKTAEPGSGSFGKIRVKVITVANRIRTLKLLRDLGDDKAVTSGLAGFLGLVEIHNFTKALKAYTNNQNDDRKWEQFAPLVASFLQLPAAIKGVKGLVAKAAAEAAPKAAAGGGLAVAQVGLDRVREAQAAKVGYSKLFKRLNLIANLIELELTLSSFIENLAQNDDAAIADAIGLGGITFGIVATFVNIPGAGWIICLAAIAYWLAKAYLFVEDVPVEVWLENGPFVRGNEYHEAFCYKLSTTIKKVKDAKGKWVDTACAVHRYDNFEFLVDSGGILVHAGPSQYHPPGQPCRVTPDGAVYLKARKWYDLPTNKHHEIPADTTVATIGQPFTMHPLLKTTVQEKPKITPNNQTGWKKKAALYATVGGFLYDRYQTSKEKFIGWQHPRGAYLALADAVYRPRVTLTETSTMIGRRQSTVALKVDLPFYIPGKSELFIEYEIEFKVKGGKKIRDKEEIEKISHNPVSNINLNGPGGYEIIRTVYPGESRTFTAKVRLDLFGDGEVQLPCEPLFCGSEIKTEKEEKTVEGVQLQTATKWIVAKKSVTQGPITHFDMILNPGDSGTRHPGKWA
jgi:hypothetical protein